LIPAEARSLLDIGAGQGGFLKWLEDHRPELSLAGLERARAAVAAAVCRTPIEVGSVEQLPYDDAAFDVVTALEVLEHLPQATYAAGRAELVRVARSIIVSVPHAEQLTQVRCPECGCRFHPNYHMRSFDPGAFGSLFDGFVLDRQEVISFDDYVGGTVIRAGYRLLRGGAGEMQPGNLCPQCGYRETASGSVRAWARRSVKTRMPKVSRPRWLLGRFVRR
jgi:DNA-directed RNA polymerase subunit RPC12/RpoP